MIDTHTHLNFKNFSNDLDQIIRKSFDEGIEKMIIPGSSIKNSKEAVEIANKYDEIYAAVGIHPEELPDVGDFAEIKKLAENKKVVAIGECGLDYFRLEGDLEKVKIRQKELFVKHIELAKALDLPLIFHNRDSEEEFFEIIKDQRVRGVLHCYTGNWEFAKKILDLDLMISFTGIITFDKTGELEEVVKNIPLAKVMVETDAPFLAPIPYRGKTAEPWMVKEVIEKIAEIKNISFKEVEEITSANAKSFFGI